MSGRLELSDAKLGNAEVQIEDLKQQLDDALGAEDMLEQLTDRNLQMSEVSASPPFVFSYRPSSADGGDASHDRRPGGA